MKLPLIFKVDSYKLSHFFQYPEGTQYISSFIESRGGKWDNTVFFGLQGFIKENLLTPISKLDVLKMARFAKAHGVSFNEAGWNLLLERHKGWLPIRIQAVPEGTVIKGKNVLVQITNTDPDFAWLVSYVETALLRAIWYPTTVATLSRECKKTIKQFLDQTSDNPDAINFMLHDFGARGVSSSESAQVGGAAHLLNFMGSDTIEGILWLQEHYGNAEEMPAFSVDATEHSTVTSWGRDGEADMYANYLKAAAPNKILSCVSDSYDIYNAITNIWGGKLKAEVQKLGEIGARLVVRPDSGDPTVVPIECVRLLMQKFGYTINTKGFKVLPPYLRVLQGDGINDESLKDILIEAAAAGFSAENFVFGMGGGLLQHVNRDTLKFAMKASAACVNGEWRDVYKDPITDPGKKSKKGRLALVVDGHGDLYTIREDDLGYHHVNELLTVYENGQLLIETNIDNMRALAAV